MTSIARTVLFHSLAFNEPLKGLSRLELNFSLYGPGVDPAFAGIQSQHDFAERDEIESAVVCGFSVEPGHGFCLVQVR